MKSYPSIPKYKEAGMPNPSNCTVFEKLDGSNLRFEWRNKWLEKYGTRTQLFDESHPIFAPAIAIFYNQWAKDIAKILKKEQIQRAVVFLEYYGPSSFAGWHNEQDILKNKMSLTLFDIYVYKQGLIPPRKFVKLFGHLEIPEIIYEGNFNQELIEAVENGEYNVFEGVVAKGGNNSKNLWMIKIKTKKYLKKLKGEGKDSDIDFG